MREFGGALFGLGVLGVVVAMFIDPSVATYGGGYGSGYGVPERVVNLQRLQMQLMIFQGGLGAIVAGSVLLAVGTLTERLEASGILKRSTAPEAATGNGAPSCEWCDQMIPTGRKPCSAVSEEKLRVVGPKMPSGTCRQMLAERGLLGEERADG